MLSSGTAKGQPRQISKSRLGSAWAMVGSTCMDPAKNTLGTVSANKSKLRPYLTGSPLSKSSASSWGNCWLSVMRQRLAQLQGEPLELRSELGVEHANFGFDTQVASRTTRVGADLRRARIEPQRGQALLENSRVFRVRDELDAARASRLAERLLGEGN